MAKIVAGEELTDGILSGAGQLARAVAPNFGPNGKNTVVDKKYDIPRVVNEGKQILPEFTLEDPVESIGAALLRDAALNTGKHSGDGTIATTIIAGTVLKEGQRLISAGADPVRMRQAMVRLLPQLCQAIRAGAIPADSRQALMQIAQAAADNTELAQLVMEAFDLVGTDGAINVMDSQETACRLDAVEGVRYEYGLMNMSFVNRPVQNDTYLENPYILVANMNIERLEQLEKLLTQVIRCGRPLLIVAKEVKEELQGLLNANNRKGRFQVICAKAPGFGDTRRRNMQALALKTGAGLIEENCGLELSDFGLEICGQADSATITKDFTTLLGVRGEMGQEVETMKRKVARELQDAKTSDDVEKLNTTLAILEGRVATIYAGGYTEYEMFEKMHRMENTVQAVRAAAKGGIVAGGGKGWLLAIPCLRQQVAQATSEDERFALVCLEKALLAPAAQLADNSGADSGSVLARLLEHLDEPSYGYNTATHTFEDFSQTGIFDPVDTVCRALQIGVEAAATMLTVTAAVME